MLMVLEAVLDRREVAALRTAAGKAAFEDGRRTAGRFAREVKANEQAVDSPDRAAIFAKVQATLMAHALFVSAARPRGFARMLLSRYRPGMEYGAHVDDAVMDGVRTDLSFTLALSDPADYDGAGLVVSDSFEDRVIRLGAGDMVLYPSTTLHRVEPVTRGERLAVVGWVTSLVRDPASREVLFDLDQAVNQVHEAMGRCPSLDLLLKTRSNLLRRWVA
jgi:PKHD-type hydroxylase